MAHHLYPATVVGIGRRTPSFPNSAGLRLRLPPEYGALLSLGTGRDDAEGDPAPCLRVRGIFGFHFRIPVDAGARSLSVQAKQPVAGVPRPILILHATRELSLAAQSAMAPDGAGWVAVGPITFTAPAKGAVWVELRNPAQGYDGWFDNLALA